MTLLSLSTLTTFVLCLGFGAPPGDAEPASVDLSFDASTRVDAEAPPVDPTPRPDRGADETSTSGDVASDAAAASSPTAPTGAAGAEATPYATPATTTAPPQDGWQSTDGGYAVPYADRPPRDYPEIPIKWRAELGVAAASNIGTHPTYLVADENGRSLAVEVSARGDARLGKSRFFLGGTLAYRQVTPNWGGGPLGGLDSYQSLSREPKAGLRASFMAVEGVDVLVQVQGGVSVLRSELRVFDGSNTDSKQVDVLPLVEPGAGVLLYLPKKWLPRRGSSRVTVGLELAASYAWRGPARLQPKLEQADDDIPAQPVSFGTMRTSGVNLQAAFVLRFM